MSKTKEKSNEKSAPRSAPRSTQDLVATLEEIAELMALASENDFKVRAFRNAAVVLAEQAPSMEDLTQIAQGKVKIAGIGQGIQSAIAEYLESGELTYKAELLKKIPEGIIALSQIPGLGPKKARVIVDELAITTIGELEYACRENRLCTLKGFGEATQKKILESIERLKANEGKRLLPDAWLCAEEISALIPSYFGRRIVGELARGSEIVNTVQYAVWDAAPSQVTSLNKTFAAKGAELVLIDVPFDELTLTEQQQLIASPLVAKKISQSQKPFLCRDGGPWEDTWLEDEWVNRKPVTDAYRRARHGRMRGVFHNHTIESDGSATLEDMVSAAERASYDYIGISDHSGTAVYANGLKTDRLLKQKEDIKKLQKKTKVRIFHGVESDILQDGSLDYPDDILTELDFVVASIHSRFKMDAASMTARLTTALSHPHVTFWGHPTGRLLLARDGYNFDWDSVFAASKKSGVAFEVNAHPQRLDLDWRMGERVEEHNIPVCINPDAHTVAGLQDTRWGELMVEKAMIPSHLIVNLKTTDEVEEWLKKRKK